MILSDSLSLLSTHGVKTSGKIVSFDEALDLPRPAVLKADTEEHKTDKGMVFVGLKTDEEIRSAYQKISKKYAVFGQPLIDGFEFMIGAVDNRSFGKVLMVGLGGTYAELFKDVSFRAAPLTRGDAEEMIEELKLSELFKGFRGKIFDKPSLINALLKLSKLCEKVEFREIDVNPLMVREHGALALDARVIR